MVSFYSTIINLFRYTVLCYLRHSYRWNILKFWLIRLNHGTQTIAFLELMLWTGSSFEPTLRTLLFIMIVLGKDRHWSTAKLKQLQNTPLGQEKFDFPLHIQELTMHLPKIILCLNHNLRDLLFTDMMPCHWSPGTLGMTYPVMQCHIQEEQIP